MLELIIAMALLTLLSLMVIGLINDGMNIFGQGIRESDRLDKTGAILPKVRQDVSRILVPDSMDPPLPPADIDDLNNTQELPPPPPIWERLRAGYFPLKNQPEGPTKDLPIYIASWVIDISSNMPPLLRERGGGSTSEAVPYTPENVEKLTADTRFQASGGQMEIVYVAIPKDPNNPAILTLYRGYRAPVGDPEASLLLPENVDTVAEIQKACRPVAEGVLHFEITWRRIHATSWQLEESKQGPGGNDSLTVSPRWDSTRALDPKFAMHVGRDSLGDGSDDVFPGFARIDITIADEGAFGFGQGDAQLNASVTGNDNQITVFPVGPLYDPPGLPEPRHLKIGTEWMSFDLTGIDGVENSVYVRRGVRGTVKQNHDNGAWVYVGEPVQTEIRMPVFRDRYALSRRR